MEPLRIFIGYDSKLPVQTSVLAHSIHSRASCPVAITPINLAGLGPVFQRPRDPLQSTEFSFSRFLTPYLSGYRGWSLFMDCDMLMLADVAELFALADDRFAVMACQHQYEPGESKKFLNNTQTKYNKKNWSSVVLFNNDRCRALNPDYINQATGLDLHQFKWLNDDGLIGSLPLAWNYLVGVYPACDPAHVKNLHFTIGGPYFEAYRDCDFSDLWWQAYYAATACADPAHR